VLIGAVHDFSTLAASVRHGAHSIAEIAREHLGTRAGRALMGFIWIALIYVSWPSRHHGGDLRGRHEGCSRDASRSTRVRLIALSCTSYSRSFSASAIRAAPVAGDGVFVPRPCRPRWLGNALLARAGPRPRIWGVLILPIAPRPRAWCRCGAAAAARVPGRFRPL
jgi:hypothetical protein